jgi:hypothetical protein
LNVFCFHLESDDDFVVLELPLALGLSLACLQAEARIAGDLSRSMGERFPGNLSGSSAKGKMTLLAGFRRYRRAPA